MARTGSLRARTNSVLGLSAIAIAIIAVVALDTFVTTPITERAANDEAGLLVLSAQTWVELLPDRRPHFELELLINHDLTISGENRDLPAVLPGNEYHEMLVKEIGKRVGETVVLLEGDDLLWVNVPTESGLAPQIGFASQRGNVQPGYVALLILVAGTIVVFGTSFLMVRWVADPLNRAAKAAQSFRGATGFVPLPEEGPRELVSLASSFNDMAHEIMSLMANRTTLLAGVSHDLRTPLARMRFALELLPESVDQNLVNRLDRNLGAMDELIEDALRFARGTQEASVEIELREFLRSVVNGVDKTISLTWKGDEEVIVNTALGALERVFNNLLANALQHGGTTEVRVDAGENIDIHVIDNGPGIPAQDREKVFQPFYRIEGSRSRHTGGSGLGLAIVHQLCQAHGWRIELFEADAGGTDARLTLPTA